jgi:hypothetical protein
LDKLGKYGLDRRKLIFDNLLFNVFSDFFGTLLAVVGDEAVVTDSNSVNKFFMSSAATGQLSMSQKPEICDIFNQET